MQTVELKSHEVSYAVNEEIKYLRANIQFSGADKKVILMTSAISGEGKSTISLRLAQSLTELGKTVLLIDADLRRSVLRNELVNKADVNYGLSHYLSGMASVEEVFTAAGTPPLYMILAGPTPPNPSELLASQNLDTLLEWARQQFDYVLIDTAPLGTVIDAAVIAPKCDGAAIVIESGRVPRRVAQSVVQQLRDANCPVLGVILNKVDTHTGRKYYSHYYHREGYEYGDTSRQKKK